MEQLKLDLTFYPFCEYLGGFQRVRKAIGAASNAVRPWAQLELRFVLRQLVKAGTVALSFLMPSGREIRVPTLRALFQQLAAPVMRFFNLQGRK